jgi:hypothetical protein
MTGYDDPATETDPDVQSGDDSDRADQNVAEEGSEAAGSTRRRRRRRPRRRGRRPAAETDAADTPAEEAAVPASGEADSD